MRIFSQLFAFTLLLSSTASADSLEHIRVSEEGTHFVREASGKRFIVWGVNYDHDSNGRLLDEYWMDEWAPSSKTSGNQRAWSQLCQDSSAGREVLFAPDIGLYLDVTGLAWGSLAASTLCRG